MSEPQQPTDGGCRRRSRKTVRCASPKRRFILPIRKYAYCVAENEAESPWPPLHVERGFDIEDSTVTVTGADGPHNLNDHISDHADGILATLEGAMSDMGANNAYLYGQPTIAFGPEHAAILAAGGWSKHDIRRYVFERVRLPRAL